jgi:hypothetical protein
MRRTRAVGPFSVEPLLAICEEREIALGDLFSNKSGSVIKRWKEHGLTEAEADEAAVHLGMHPSWVWGVATWYQGVA